MSDAPLSPIKAIISLWPHVIDSVEKSLAAGNIKELPKMHAILDCLGKIRDAVKFLDGCPELAPVEVPEAVAPVAGLKAVPKADG